MFKVGSRGAKSSYTPELGEQLAQKIAEGKSIRQISKEPGMPSASTIYLWTTTPSHPFYPLWEAAKRVRLETWVENALEVCEGGGEDSSTRVARDRLRLDAIKWYAGKCLPKVYGDNTRLLDAEGEGPPVLRIEMVPREEAE